MDDSMSTGTRDSQSNDQSAAEQTAAGGLDSKKLSRRPGVKKSPVGLAISSFVMIGWLLYLAYLAFSLG